MGLVTGRVKRVLRIGKLVRGGNLKGVPLSSSIPRVGDREEKRNATIGARAYAPSWRGRYPQSRVGTGSAAEI